MASKQRLDTTIYQILNSFDEVPLPILGFLGAVDVNSTRLACPRLERAVKMYPWTLYESIQSVPLFRACFDNPLFAPICDTTVGIDQLRAMPSLREIDALVVQEAVLPDLLACPQITRLYVSCHNEDFLPWTEDAPYACGGLNTLTLNGFSMDLDMVQRLLATLPNLTELNFNLQNHVSDDALRACLDSTQLTSLHLGDMYLEDHLEDETVAQVLQRFGRGALCKGVQMTEDLVVTDDRLRLTAYAIVGVNGCDYITDEHLPFFNGNSRISFEDCPVTAIGITEHMCRNPMVVELCFMGATYFSDDCMTRMVLACPNVHTLTLDAQFLSLLGLSRIVAWPLKSLNLSSIFDDERLAVIATCTTLKRLRLRRGDLVTNEGVALLGQCSILEGLSIVDCPLVTAAGIDALEETLGELDDLSDPLRAAYQL